MRRLPSGLGSATWPANRLGPQGAVASSASSSRGRRDSHERQVLGVHMVKWGLDVGSPVKQPRNEPPPWWPCPHLKYESAFGIESTKKVVQGCPKQVAPLLPVAGHRQYALGNN